MEEFYCYKTLDEIFNKDEVLSCIATGPELFLSLTKKESKTLVNHLILRYLIMHQRN